MKPVILIFIHYYLPGFRAGGPIRTIANLVEQLHEDFIFKIVATDRDLGDVVPFESIKVDEWSRVGNADVIYLSPASCSLSGIAKIIRDTPHDVLYLNSFFDPVFTLKPLIARYIRISPSKPLIVAPRGEFSRGALVIKRWKKAPYIAVLKKLRIFGNGYWQASSDSEARDIFRVLGGSEKFEPRRVLVASDFAMGPASFDESSVTSLESLPFAPKFPSDRRENERSGLRICFLSRIVPMKNLDYALTVLSKVGVPVRFDIYGPQEDAAYWTECQRLIALLPQNIKVAVCGSVEHKDVVQVLAQYDLFFLPTRGENFGHVIYEALRAGTSVLISNETPWCGLEEHGVGWSFPLSDGDSFVRAIEDISRWNSEMFELAQARAKSYAERIASNSDVRNANIKLFKNAIGSDAWVI